MIHILEKCILASLSVFVIALLFLFLFSFTKGGREFFEKIGADLEDNDKNNE